MIYDKDRRDLGRLLRSVAAGVSFQGTQPFEYWREFGSEVCGSITFPVRSDPRGYVAFSCYAGVHHLVLERLLEFGDTGVISSSLGQLKPDGRFAEWKYSSAEELRSLSETVTTDIRRYVVPFLIKFSDVDVLADALASPDPKAWYSLGPDRRVCVLAAIHWTTGHHRLAMRLIDDALIERRVAPPKRRMELEALKRKLISAPSEARPDSA